MKIRITPGAVLFLLVLAKAGAGTLFCALIAAAVHECGHLLAARLFRIRVRLLELDIPGASILPHRALPSYRAEAALSAGGPLASLLLALLLAPLPHPVAREICLAALSQALFNLLPISGFDGGRVLCALLAPHLGPIAAARVLNGCTYLLILLLFSLASCLLLRFGASFMLAVLCAFLFAKIFLLQPPQGRGGKQK